MILFRKIFIFFFITAVILRLFSCASSVTQDQNTVQIIQGEIVDSISLFTDSTSYRYVNTEKLSEDNLLVFQHPMLNLTSLNSKGESTASISKKGDGLSDFSGIFINPVWANDELFVIDQGENFSKIYIFNDKFQYTNQLRILDDTDYIISPILGNTIVKEQKDTLVLYANIDNKLYSTWDKNLYKKGYGMVKIKIFDKKVISTEFGLPIREIASLTTSINNGERHWTSITPHFDIVNEKIYVKYSFDKNIYVYDLDFNLVDQIQLSPFHKSKDVKIKIGKNSVTEKRLFLDRKINCSNLSFNSMKIFEDKVYLLYRKPLPENKIPKTMFEEYNISYQNVLHVFDLKTELEYSIDLPLKFSSYTSINLNNNSNLYFTGNEKETENIYLYEYQLSY